MIEKNASVHWEGGGKQGQGLISTESGAPNEYPYGFPNRSWNDRRGSNPEEILAAALSAQERQDCPLSKALASVPEITL